MERRSSTFKELLEALNIDIPDGLRGSGAPPLSANPPFIDLPQILQPVSHHMFAPGSGTVPPLETIPQTASLQSSYNQTHPRSLLDDQDGVRDSARAGIPQRSHLTLSDMQNPPHSFEVLGNEVRDSNPTMNLERVRALAAFNQMRPPGVPARRASNKVGHTNLSARGSTAPFGRDVTATFQGPGIQNSTAPGPAAAPSRAPIPLPQGLPNNTQGARNGQGCDTAQSGRVASSITRNLTRDQIIVGHFCRNALSSFRRALSGTQHAKMAEEQLKANIKSAWHAWISCNISKEQLVSAVSQHVRFGDPLAANLDVIAEFRDFYREQFELEQRTGAAAAQVRAQQVQRNRGRQSSATEKNRTQRPNGKASGKSGVTQSHPGPAPPHAPAQNTRRNLEGVSATAGGISKESHVVLAQPYAAQLNARSGNARSSSRGTKQSRPVSRHPKAATPHQGLHRGSRQEPAQGSAAESRAVTGVQRTALRKIGTQPESEHLSEGKALNNTGEAATPEGATSVTEKNLLRNNAVADTTAFRPNMVSNCATEQKPGGEVNTSIQAKHQLRVSGKPRITSTKVNRNGKSSTGDLSGNGDKSIGVKPADTRKGQANKKNKADKNPKAWPSKRKKVPEKTNIKKCNDGNAGSMKTAPLNPSPSLAEKSYTKERTDGKRTLGKSTTSPAESFLKKMKMTPNASAANVAKGLTNSKDSQARRGNGKLLSRTEIEAKQPSEDVIFPSAVTSGVGGEIKMATAKAARNRKGSCRKDDSLGEEDEVGQLNMMKDIVDIAHEEANLGRDAERAARNVEADSVIVGDMLLSGDRLREKMQACAKRLEMEEHIGKVEIELMAYAVRDHLMGVLESIYEQAVIRRDNANIAWGYAGCVGDIFEQLELGREQEDQELRAAAAKRIAKRILQKEENMEKQDGEMAEGGAGSGDEAADVTGISAAEQGEKLIKVNPVLDLEVSRVMHGLDVKGLPAPLPLPGRGGSRVKTADFAGSDAGKKLYAPGAGKEVGKSASSYEDEKKQKATILLQDCLAWMKSDEVMRRSTLLYKWKSRLGTREEHLS